MRGQRRILYPNWTFWLWFYTFNTMCSVLHVSIIGSPVFREAKPYLHHQEKWSWHMARYWHVQGERTQSNNSREMKMSISAGGSVQLLFFIIFAQINIQHSNLHSIVFLYLLHRWAAVRVQKYSTVLRQQALGKSFPRWRNFYKVAWYQFCIKIILSTSPAGVTIRTPAWQHGSNPNASDQSQEKAAGSGAWQPRPSPRSVTVKYNF